MKLSYCRILPFLVPLPLAIMLGGCGGRGGDSGPTPIPINHPPSVSLVQPDRNPYTLDVRTAQFMDITIKADDEDGGVVNCIWTWDAGSVSPNEQSVAAGSQVTARFTPPEYDTTCNVKVTVSDGEASVDANITIEVTGNGITVNQFRITNVSMTPDPVAPSQTATLSAQVQNPSGKPLTYKWNSRYGRISGTGQAVTWTAPSAPGVYGLYLTVSDGDKKASIGRGICVAGPTGGLKGEYFRTAREKNIVRFTNLVLTRLDPNVNFLWEKTSPDIHKLPVEGWGARWTGYIKCEQPGDYVFRVHVDDGIRMKIQNDAGEWVGAIPNNTTNWTDHNRGAWLPEYPEAVHLQGGKWYPLEVEFFQGAADAFVTLYWSVNGGRESVVQQVDLKPPGS